MKSADSFQNQRDSATILQQKLDKIKALWEVGGLPKDMYESVQELQKRLDDAKANGTSLSPEEILDFINKLQICANNVAALKEQFDSQAEVVRQSSTSANVDPENPFAIFTFLPSEQGTQFLEKWKSAITQEEKDRLLKFAGMMNNNLKLLKEMSAMSELLQRAKGMGISGPASVNKEANDQRKQTDTASSNDNSKKLSEIGMQLFREQKYIPAISVFVAAIEVIKVEPNFADNKGNLENLATLDYNIGSAHMKISNYAQAKLYLESACASRKELFGDSDARTLKAIEKLSECDKSLDAQQSANARRYSLVM